MKNLIDALKSNYVGSINKKGYFDSYTKNIFGGKMDEDFQTMFDEGSGSELHSKAEAVHSSSMLSYNFFHWIDDRRPFEWDGVKYTQVLFEVKMKTIKLKKGNNPPANMDVVLVDKDNTHLMFIESKFTEYLENTKKDRNKVISNSYKENDNWYTKDIKWNDVISSIPSDGYQGGIKQIITHLFGIHGLISRDDSKREITNKYIGEHCDYLRGIDFKAENMKFITLIFEPSEEFVEEHQAYINYNTLFIDFQRNIERVKGLEVIPKWVSYSKIWAEMKKQGKMPDGLEDYLWNRYMLYAQKCD